MAYIYKITNLVNNKIYIGETTRTIQTRWNEHKSSCQNENSKGYNYHLHNAMRYYGIINFKIEEIEKCEDNERFIRETYYIQLYKSYDRKKGYNDVIEGEGNSPYSTQDFLDAWNEGLRIFQIAEKLGCHYTIVAKRLLANGITIEQLQERHKSYLTERDGRPVLQYSLNGELIKEFPSTGSCNKAGFQQSAVCNVCNQKQKSAYNFLWKYKDDPRPIEEWIQNYQNKKEAGKPKKVIIQYDLNKKEINRFESAAAAARYIGLADKSCICRAARVEGKSHGYYWRYAEN